MSNSPKLCSIKKMKNMKRKIQSSCTGHVDFFLTHSISIYRFFLPFVYTDNMLKCTLVYGQISICKVFCSVAFNSFHMFIAPSSGASALGRGTSARFLHLIKQEIHLLLHSQHIRRLALFNLLIRDTPPPIMRLATTT